MWLSVVTFRFKSDDLAAEEANYFENHLGVARTLPGLRHYFAGKLRTTRKLTPTRYRAGIITFDDGMAAGSALMQGPLGAALMADTAAHMSKLDNRNGNVDVVVAPPTGAGRDCFVLTATFGVRDEARYREKHVGLARRLPGLRGYLASPGLALLVFDDYDAMRAAYRSPVGQEVNASAAAELTELRVNYVDARTEV